jgi:predicted GTPase
MGAAGRDFHNFNTVYRDNDAYEVVAFTCQIQTSEGAPPLELARNSTRRHPIDRKRFKPAH